jgi:hypothetical protein
MQYESSKVYKTGDKVIHNGVAYTALMPSMGQSPGNPKFWSKYTDSVGIFNANKGDKFPKAEEYSLSKNYKVGEAVTYKGVTYKANKASVGKNPIDNAKDWGILWEENKALPILPKDNTPIQNKDIAMMIVNQHGFNGKDGINGINGKDGLNGRDGFNGTNGKDGINGLNGKDGLEGKDGIGLDFVWDGTKLGIKKDNEKSYSFTDLKGDVGRALIGGGSSNKFKLTSASITGSSLISSAKPSAASLKTLVAGTNISFSTTPTTITINGTAATLGGTDTQVQFNDSGAFGGDADFTWNKTTNVLSATNVLATTITNTPQTTSVTGTQNAFTPTSNIVIHTGASAATFNGIVSSANMRRVTIVSSGQVLYFNHESTSATAANRLSLGARAGATLEIPLGTSVTFTYNTNNSRWALDQGAMDYPTNKTIRYLQYTTGQNVLDVNNRTLFGASGIPSVDFGGRYLYTSASNIVADWESSILRSGGVTSIDWANRELETSSAFASVLWQEQWLNSDYSGSTTVDWRYGYLYDQNGYTSADWVNRYLQDSSTNTAVNWQIRTLNDSVGDVSVDWEGRYLTDFFQTTSIHAGDRLLLDSSGLMAVDWYNRQLLLPGGSTIAYDWALGSINDNTGVLSIGPDVRQIFALDGSTPVIDWSAYQLNDGNNFASVNWAARQLSDSSGVAAFDWGSRAIINASNVVTVDAGTANSLYDSTGVTSIAWNDRMLKASSGATQLTWASAGTLAVSDAVNLSFGTTTGTKHGTATSQKQSFWNATPIVQPTTAVAAATFIANTGTTVHDASTFDGYTIKQVVKALRNIGLLA